MKHRRFLSTGRLVALGLILLVQVIWLVIIFSNIVDYSVWINIVFVSFSFLMILYLINKGENPAYQLSWIILVALLPIFGGLLYLLVGNKRPTKQLSQQIKAQSKLHCEGLCDLPSVKSALRQINPHYEGLATYVESQTGLPLYLDREVTYYPNGESLMDPLLEDLRQAKEFIFLEFFIIDYGEFSHAVFDILAQKAAEGLDVRLIYDDFGCLIRLPDDFDQQMDRKGIKTLKFNPFTPVISLAVNTRDHRKIVIIDGKVAYTGGLNLADEYINRVTRFGYWKDNMIRLAGDSVWSLTYLFLEMWNAYFPLDVHFRDFRRLSKQDEPRLESYGAAKAFIQPFGDSPLDTEPLAENIYRQILNMATDYVYIYTPYLVISYEMENALMMAAKRGIDVRLMVPGIPDKNLVFRLTRSFYPHLLHAGVRIFEYTPGFVHAKTFVSDDNIAVVGSINLDFRSLFLHFEVGSLLYYQPIIQDIRRDFEDSQVQAHEIFLADTHQSQLGELWDAVLRLLAPFI
ncbi:cardiolipin synthase [Vaginisenegalia massiliensis]|uniref:cardiolipin synthase n=1 Tax=Vaginisenegalia massiliensis TaxID=2058294 RepID=UPI000F54538A|nr:cardiolipin synthase [Vaginisenegalia massiliensis]